MCEIGTMKYTRETQSTLTREADEKKHVTEEGTTTLREKLQRQKNLAAF